MKKLLQKILKALAAAILKKYNPDIVAITGSVGKTSTKEAVFLVLEKKFNVRKNIKNYNNEIGIPLTVLGEESGGKSIFRWAKIFLAAFRLLFFKDKNYPKILVLEMGADKPGDIAYLTNFIKPKVGVVTAVSPTHTEFFKSLEKVAKEKSILIKTLPKDGLAILNQDDKLVSEMKKLALGRVVTFGFSTKADIAANEIKNSDGLNFKLHCQGSVVPVFLEDIIAPHLISSVLPAVAVGLFYGLNLVDIANSLKKFKAPPGRMNKIFGIKGSVIIDDTYNSSPLAVQEALKVLGSFPLAAGAKHFAVLGDMLELGGLSERAHQEVGETAADLKIEVLITVGEQARDIARGAIKRGLTEDRVFSFGGTEEAGKFLQSRIGQGDVILIKGSQGVRLEKIVKEIMADPQFAKELLVRQGREWG